MNTMLLSFKNPQNEVVKFKCVWDLSTIWPFLCLIWLPVMHMYKTPRSCFVFTNKGASFLCQRTASKCLDILLHVFLLALPHKHVITLLYKSQSWSLGFSSHIHITSHTLMFYLFFTAHVYTGMRRTNVSKSSNYSSAELTWTIVQ